MSSWKEHSGRVAWPTLLLTSALAVWTGAVYAGAFAGRLPLPFASVMLVVAIYGWFTPLHEAIHGNVGGSRRYAWLDEAVGWLAGAMFLVPFPAYRAIHLRHHGTVNRAGQDPDLWVSGGSASQVVFRCLTVIPHYYLFLFGPMRRAMPGLGRVLRRSAPGFLLAGLWVLGLALSGRIDLLFWLWLVPLWSASGLLVFAFDWLPHHPHEETERFTNTRAIEGGWLFRVLLLGQDAHLIHHLWPKVPFYRYHTVLESEREVLVARGARIDRLVEIRAR